MSKTARPLSPLLGNTNANSTLKDELGRRPFAQGISKLIQSHSPDTCTVIGIEGAWGTGKSYTIELVRRELEQDSSVRWLVFNPWHFTDRNHLAKLFLLTLSDAILPDTWWVRLRKAVTRSKPFAKILSRVCSSKWLVACLTGGALGILTKTEGWLASLGYVSVAGFSPLIVQWLTSHLFVKEEDDTTFSISNALKDYADSVEDLESVKSKKTLSQLKEEVVTKLKKDKLPFKHIVVAVEDLDRLEPKEVHAMVQLMRMVADFPRITYLVGYDRNQVIRALGEQVGTHADKQEALNFGEGYLHKVVHTSYKLPEASALAAANLVLTHFYEMTQGIYGKDFPKSAYWQKVSPFFAELWKTVRDGEKVVNRALLLVTMLQEKSNPVDVLVAAYFMEYQPKLWDWIWQNQDEILGGGRKLIRNSHETAQQGSLEAQIVGDKKTVESVVSLSQNVFPSLSYDGPHHFSAQDRQNFPMGSRDFIESYFKYDVTAVAELQVIIPDLFKTSGAKRRKLLSKILSYGDEGIFVAVRDLNDIHEQNPLKWTTEALPLLEDLAQISDGLPKPPGTWGMTPADRIFWLTIEWVNRLPESTRSQAIQEVISHFIKVDAKYLAMSLYEKLGQEGGWIPYEGIHKSDKPFQLKLTNKEVQRLKGIVENRIVSWTAHDAKVWLEHHEAGVMLSQWLRIDKDKARTTIDSWIADDWMIFYLLQTMMADSYSQGLSVRQGAVSRYTLSPYGLKKLFGMDASGIKTRVREASIRNPHITSQFGQVVAAVDALPDNLPPEES